MYFAKTHSISFYCLVLVTHCLNLQQLYLSGSVPELAMGCFVSFRFVLLEEGYRLKIRNHVLLLVLSELQFLCHLVNALVSEKHFETEA